MPSISLIAFFGGISRSWRLARVVTWLNGPQSVGEIGEAGQLPVLHDAVRNAQPAHVGVLRRRDIEHAVIAPAEIVRRLRRRVVERLLPQSRIGIERMLVALELLLVGELLAGCDDLVLRLDVDGIGPVGSALALPALPPRPRPTRLICKPVVKPSR